MDDGELGYHYAQIEAMIDQLRGFVTNLGIKMDDVNKRFEDLCANGWDGASAAAFHGAKNVIKNKTDDLNMSLTDLHQKVAHAADDMSNLDNSLAGGPWL